MAITSIDQLAAGLASAQHKFLMYPSGTTVAGGLTNLSRLVAGAQGQAGIPLTAASGGQTHSTNQTGYVTPNNPQGGNTLYVGRAALSFATAGTISWYDRLYAASGFSGTVTTAQTITAPPAFSRNTTGAGAVIFIESYTATGATPANVTVQYTNSAGVSGRNTVSEPMITSMPAGRLLMLRLQADDVGVQSIQSVTLSLSTGTAGNFGVVVAVPIYEHSSAIANVTQVYDYAQLSLPALYTGACLMPVHLGTTTSTGVIMGSIDFVQG
jgi:hypothetical protein